MPKGSRKCKVCGKEYEYCRTHRPTSVFRWQDVACCPEHAKIYFDMVEASRNPKKSEVEPVEQIVSEPEVVEASAEAEVEEAPVIKRNKKRKNIYRPVVIAPEE